MLLKAWLSMRGGAAGVWRTFIGYLLGGGADLSSLPRLAGHGVEMSRLGGGIGTRGPGETKLETDRRRIAKRIKKLGRHSG